MTVDDFGDFEIISVDGDGADDVVTVGGSNTTVTVESPGVVDGEPGTVCTKSGDLITCTNANGFEEMDASLGGGSDMLTSNLDVPMDVFFLLFVFGGDGTDTLIGSDDADPFELLFGGNDPDSLDGRGGDDTVLGGDGTDPQVNGGEGDDFAGGGDGDGDQVDGGNGDDGVSGDEGNNDNVRGGDGDDFVEVFRGDGSDDASLDGGPGVDTVAFFDFGPVPATAATNVTVDLAAGRLTTTNNDLQSDSLAGIEDALTAGGDDTLTGTDGINLLTAGDGSDSIDGRLGADQMFGGDGGDTLQARDGFQDRANCGAGATDTGFLDQLDEGVGCESAQVAFVQPFGTIPPDVTPASCAVAGLRSRQRRTAFFRGVRFRVTCNEATRLEVRLFVRVRRVRRGRFITSRAGDFTLGERNLAQGTGTRSVRVRPSRRFRRPLGRRFRGRIRIDAFDAAGNRTTINRRVRVR